MSEISEKKAGGGRLIQYIGGGIIGGLLMSLILYFSNPRLQTDLFSGIPFFFFLAFVVIVVTFFLSFLLVTFFLWLLFSYRKR